MGLKYKFSPKQSENGENNAREFSVIDTSGVTNTTSKIKETMTDILNIDNCAKSIAFKTQKGSITIKFKQGIHSISKIIVKGFNIATFTIDIGHMDDANAIIITKNLKSQHQRIT